MDQKSNLHFKFIEEPNSFQDNTANSFLSQTPSLVTPFDIYQNDDDSKQQPNQGFSVELQPQGKSATPAPAIIPQQQEKVVQPSQVPQLNTQPSLEQISHAISMPDTLNRLEHPSIVEIEGKITMGYWLYNVLLCCELVGGMIGIFVVVSVAMYAETMNTLIATFFFDSLVRTIGCLYAFKARAKFNVDYQHNAIMCFILMVIFDIAYSVMEVATYQRFMQEDPVTYRPEYNRFVSGVIMTGAFLIMTTAILLYFAGKILKLIKERDDIIENSGRGDRSVSVQY